MASFFLSLATCFLGHVNSIAPIVGNFMLAMFVVLNLACATLELTEAPNFRPKFRLCECRNGRLGPLTVAATLTRPFCEQQSTT